MKFLMKHLKYSTILIFFLSLLHCNSPDNNMNQNNTDMVYKLYVIKSNVLARDSKGIALFDEFKLIYKENNVKVIGVWVNEDDPNELYFMTAFEDDDHYEQFIGSMKDHKRYQEMSLLMESERESIKAVSLKMAVSL